MGGGRCVVIINLKASLGSTETGLPTGTELGNRTKVIKHPKLILSLIMRSLGYPSHSTPPHSAPSTTQLNSSRAIGKGSS